MISGAFAIGGLAIAVVSALSDPVWQFGVALGFIVALLGAAAWLEGEGGM